MRRRATRRNGSASIAPTATGRAAPSVQCAEERSQSFCAAQRTSTVQPTPTRSEVRESDGDLLINDSHC